MGMNDVKKFVQYRDKVLATFKELDSITVVPGNTSPTCTCPESVKPRIRVVHDESTFYATSDHCYMWGDDETNFLKQKSLEQSIMVSDFIDGLNGYLEFQGNMARCALGFKKIDTSIMISLCNKLIMHSLTIDLKPNMHLPREYMFCYSAHEV